MVSHDLSVDRWLICLSGFLQRYGDIIGMIKLQRLLQMQFGSDKTEVIIQPWNADMEALAELIFRLRPKAKPRIAIFCYSWGATAALILSNELRRLGFEVEVIVSSDGVYRHRYFAGNWRALVKHSKLVVPDNVRQVYWFNQANPVIDFSRPWSRIIEPAGHEFVAADPSRTKIEHVATLTAAHTSMDDVDAFHDMALAQAKRLTAV